jgi:ankyrin repeat protein
LYTDSLAHKGTVKEIKSCLDRLSKHSAAFDGALDEAYKDALGRIQDQPSGLCERAKKVLWWITFAERPLTTAEICSALAVELEETELDPENILDADDLASVCAGLVVIDPGSAIIRLVHYTAQEYFERIRDTWDPNGQLYIAKTCLKYLSFDSFGTGSCPTLHEFRSRMERYEFLDYAAKHWMEHARPVEADIASQACSFLLCEDLMSCASQASARSFEFHASYHRALHETSLRFAVRLELPLITQQLLLLQNRDVLSTLEARDSHGRTPLLLAVQREHYKITELLLDNWANINAQGGLYGSAIQAASALGNEQIVELLLKRGAHVNTRGGKYGSAIQAASASCNEQIVRLLLERDANVNLKGGSCGSALFIASEKGREQIVRLLIGKGAHLNVGSSIYGSPLVVAADKGHEAIVELLLIEKADPNAQFENFGNALYYAAKKGYGKIVEHLLKAGAEPKAQSGEYGNPLFAASAKGHKDVVTLLLDAGADPNAQGTKYKNTPLYAASDKGFAKVVELLLNNSNNRADPNAKGGYYGTALFAASVNGYDQVVELLLEAGADPNVPGSKYNNTPLYAASAIGLVQVVKLLLEKNADANAQGGEWGSALQAASVGNHTEVVKLLVAYGAVDLEDCVSLPPQSPATSQSGLCSTGDSVEGKEQG